MFVLDTLTPGQVGRRLRRHRGGGAGLGCGAPGGCARRWGVDVVFYFLGGVMLHIQQVIYIYVWVCICILYIYIYVYTVYIYMCILYIYIYMCVCIYVYTYYMYIFICMNHDHICKRRPIYLQMHTCTCISCHAGKISKLYSCFLVDPWCVFKWFFLCMYSNYFLFPTKGHIWQYHWWITWEPLVMTSWGLFGAVCSPAKMDSM